MQLRRSGVEDRCISVPLTEPGFYLKSCSVPNALAAKPQLVFLFWLLGIAGISLESVICAN
ncbi:hypothetical protein BO71DRAFT_393832 [Aspergillus ellipticus CBS 707.79]|uniref:Uncharacterized protein n=1 Tax=Aspergillus ellipticus CBS 707.79 TaxID=1448320 RepID=A0A319DQQ5_9EURO|nr:hypothetical protein BO71DRAFT_393832 [Aspergillus ellipticus CBS 707.79]